MIKLSLRSKLLLVILCLAISMVLFNWRAKLKQNLDDLKEEYLVDLDLLNGKDQHLARYQSLIESLPIPESESLSLNEWIQYIQNLVKEENLVLRELKPVTEGKANKNGKESVYLMVEGSSVQTMSFLYRIGQSPSSIYIKRYSMNVEKDTNTIKSQITFSQL